MTLPIRVRLTASYLAVLVAMLATSTISVPVQLYHDLAGQADQSLRQRAEQLGADYNRDGDTEFVEDANAATWGLLGGQSWAQLLAPNGVLVNNSHNGLSIAPVFGTDMIRSVLGGGTRLMTVELGPQHQPFRLIARPLGKPGHRAVLVLATALDSLDVVVRHLTDLLILAGVMAVVLAGTSGWWLSRIALLPITRISRQAERIHVDHLDERIPTPTRADEVGHLARTLNAMFDRLREGVEQHRRLVADTSHELRTPLAIMRAELDVALTLPDLPQPAALALERNGAEVDRMTRIVANLLTLARIDRGELELLRRPVDLREEAITVVARFRELANAKQVLLQVDGAPPAGGRRPRAHRPSAEQPPRQRGEVHRDGNRARSGVARRRRGRGDRGRYRAGDPEGGGRSRLRPLLPDRRRPHEVCGRQRVGAGDQPGDHPGARWPDLGRQRSRPGQPVQLRVAG